MNYTELKASVAAWLKRGDLASQIPQFISLAETKLGEDLSIKAMESSTTLATTSGNAFVSLPADFRNLRALTIDGVPFDYYPPEALAARYPDSEAGQPAGYTIIGRQIKLGPTPNAAYTLGLVYQRLIPPLSDAVLTNWLIERSQNAYLFGALAMAQPYLFNDVRAPVFQQMYQDAVGAINLNDWHTAASMTVRTDGGIA